MRMLERLPLDRLLLRFEPHLRRDPHQELSGAVLHIAGKITALPDQTAGQLGHPVF